VPDTLPEVDVATLLEVVGTGGLVAGRRTKRSSGSNGACLCRSGILGRLFNNSTLLSLIFGQNLYKVVWYALVQLAAGQYSVNQGSTEPEERMTLKF
jgi:hypothetical protein